MGRRKREGGVEGWEEGGRGRGMEKGGRGRGMVRRWAW